jgi:hypothetical protein
MARSFNGTSDWISCDGARVSDGSTAFSLSVWVKAGLKTFGMVYSETDGSNSRPLFFVCQNGSSGGNGSKLELELSSIGGVDVAISTGVFFDSTWHHLGLTQNASNLITIYLDGVQDSTFTRTSLSNSSGQNPPTVRWGASRLAASTGNLYAGSLAHGATWARQLSAAEIKSLANGLLPSHLGPAHYWPMWGGDSPEPDLVSGGTDGTLTGTTKTAGGPPVGPSLLSLRGGVTAAAPLTAVGGITVPFIASGTSVFAPTLSPSSAVELDVPFIASGTTVHAPTVQGAGELDLPFITAATSVYAPTLSPSGAVALAVPFIAPTTTVWPPALVRIDTVPPKLKLVGAYRSKVTLVYDEALDPATPMTTEFAVEVNGVSNTVAGVSVAGSTVTIELSTPIAVGDRVTVSYTG